MDRIMRLSNQSLQQDSDGNTGSNHISLGMDIWTTPAIRHPPTSTEQVFYKIENTIN